MKNNTNDATALLAHIDSLIPQNGHLEFDFRDDRQYQFAHANTRKYFDTERYPGLLKVLELRKTDQVKNGFVSALGATDTGFQNGFKIPGVGLVPGTGAGTVAANGLGTVPGGYASISLLLFIKDNATGQIVASGTNNELVGTLLPVCTPAAAPSGTDLNVTAYLQYSYTPPGGGTPVSGIVTQGAYNAVADPVLTQPLSYCTTPWVPNAINIGLGRPWGDPELGVKFDYIWAEPTQAQPIGRIPFVGSVVFSQNIQALTPNTNFLLQIYVANQTGGGTVSLAPTNLANVYANFSIDPNNPMKLNWNLPAGTSVTSPGNPITFGNITWPSDMMAYFFCQIIVTLADGSFGSANVQSQITPDTDPLDGTLGIKPIAFVWHCLGEETVVRMADGSDKPIAAVVGGDRVATGGSGGWARVDYTNKGAHVGRALQLSTKSGRSIVTSENHVFLTAGGPQPASELKAGTVLVMAAGNDALTSISPLEDRKGMFYNLALSGTERGGAAPGKISTFVGNGFCVGDINAQRDYREILRNDKEWVKQQVPTYLAQDVESYFADKATGKKR